MPYKNNRDLPESVKDNIPEHAQDIYREAFNSAVKQYGKEEQAHKVAWAAVKHKYYKDETGDWVAKGKEE